MSETPRILVEGGPVHRRVNHVLAALIGFMVGVLPVLGYAAFTARDASSEAHRVIVTNCRQIELVKTGLRLTLEEARDFATTSPVRTAKEKRQADTFYSDALARLTSRHC